MELSLRYTCQIVNPRHTAVLISKHTTEQVFGKFVGFNPFSRILDFESDLRLDFVLFLKTRCIDGAGEYDVDVNTIHQEFALQRFSETWKIVDAQPMLEAL